MRAPLPHRLRKVTLEPGTDFLRLLQDLHAGRAGAARRLYDQYGPYILKAVRRRLHARLRTKFDSMDFTQDVWASFFAHVADKYQLTSPHQLVRLLTTMARNKVVQTGRALTQRQKRNVHRETSLERQLKGGADLVGPEPTPSQIVMAEESWDQLLAQQRPVHRRILLLLREGHTDATIAAEMGLSLKTVRRVARKLLP
jgi:RNA polymerase sigma factor (sigma-70 family)